MAQLAYRQMNYYKDIKTANGTETDMLMGDFFLNMPKDDQIVQVMFEGNSIIVSNLMSLLAVGISGADGTTLSTRIAEKYEIASRNPSQRNKCLYVENGEKRGQLLTCLVKI